MITSLRIENFALIDEVTIRFNDGFTVITGETGSGKSILLNALYLILGDRADFSVIGEQKDKAVVEAEIDIREFGLQDFFAEQEWDYFDTCIVRREISAQGRSRAFVNDSPVGLTELKALTSGLVHIHSQYNTLELKEADFQLNVLDILAGTSEKRNEYTARFRKWQQQQRELKACILELQEQAAMADYNAFQLNELSSLRLRETNYAALQQDYARITNADELKFSFGVIAATLGDDQGVSDLLAQIKIAIGKQAGSDEQLDALLERLESIRLEIKDIADEASAQLERAEVDPEMLERISGELDEYNKVLFKHKLTAQEELIELLTSLENAVDSQEELENRKNVLEAEVTKEEAALKSLANTLHQLRERAIPEIQKAMHNALEGLKLSGTSFEFRLEQEAALSENGNSSVAMYFSPNAGIPAVPVYKAASGGELSRVMLALQSLMASKTRLRSVFFDEIDTGVSGDVAQKMGATLAKMGQGMQVIAITHLPQVAAKGGQHLKVLKSIVNGRTQSKVIELSLEERIEETARLMSGDVINEAALENARALMQ